ncbi:DegT/DnrJ/EryC1/StrS family aminotransferase [Dinoroseobacter sp. S76]|uniref:DegT/DnrJ/EryC1/StrS family aminotransferase n=1 Tax=Dinoroseobacter sp. S76 TaxID=3415124 RepID=UPI003C7DF93C
MTDEIFTGTFTQQEPIPEAAIAAAVEVMRSGRLHRYNLEPGELGEVGALEQEFAAQTGARYCVAVASGGYAMGTAMRALGIGPGDKVLSNAFTLAPVPGSIAAVGAEPVLVEVTEDLTLDLDDLAAKAETSGARALLLSHMRGHICDMEALTKICAAHNLTLIEDCAHTMGASWGDTPTGRFGAFGCFSTQTYKHINSGEGGLLISDDAELMARAILLSGSYMLYARHGAAPEAEVFDRVKYDTPNVSGRMDHLRAAILRPQLADLPRQAERWNALYRVLEAGLSGAPGIALTHRPDKEHFVASSFQLRLPEADAEAVASYVARCAARGVELKWFGAPEPHGFTSRYDSWRYAPTPVLPRTDRVLATLLDLRLPLTFSEDDCAQIARILRAEAEHLPRPLAAE